MSSNKRSIENNIGFSTDNSCQTESDNINATAAQAIVKATSGLLGENFFRSLVLELSSLLEKKYVFVGKLTSTDALRVHTIACCADGNILDNFEYNLADTPCASVVTSGLCLFPENVQIRFPKDKLLVDTRAESYLGLPLRSSSGIALGIIAVLDDKPMNDSEAIRDIITMFALRASAELERLKYEEDLKLSEEKYRQLFENSPDAIVLLENGVCVEANPAIKSILGYEPDEVIGKTPWDVSPEYQLDGTSTRESALMHINEAIKSGFHQFEWISKHKDGKLVYTEVTLTTYDVQGKKRIQTIMRDISTQKLTSQALHESQERLQLALDAINDAVFDWRRDKGTMYFSPRWYTMLGYEPGDFTPSLEVWEDLLHPDDREKTLEEVEKHLRGETSQYTTEFRLRCKSGEYRWILVRGRAVTRDANGEALRLVGTHTDITERKLIEERLNLTQFSVDCAHDAIYWLTTDGHFTYVNAAAEKILGYSEEELMKMSVFDIDITVTPELFNEHWSEVNQHGSAIIETLIRTKDGIDIPVELTSSKLNYEGQEYFIAYVRDISDRKRAELIEREAERRMKEAIDCSPFGAFLYELRSDGNLIFTTANEAADQILNIDSSLLVGKTIEEAFPLLVSTDIPEKYRRIASFGERYEWEEVPYHNNEIQGSYHVIAFQSAPNRTAVFFRDITEKKRVEESQREMEREIERQKRQFYRDTILSVTEGKLEISDKPDIKPFIDSAEFKASINTSYDIPEIRKQVEDYCRNAGLNEERMSSLIIGVGEAMNNAIKHGQKGRVYAGHDADSIWVGIADKGTGIESLILPKAILRRGFSTKPSLGLGYSIMLDVSDRMLLHTSKHGTKVFLIKQFIEPGPKISLNDLPDTW